MKHVLYALTLLAIPLCMSAQLDTSQSKLSFTADFRFRIEQDWNSRKSDGSFREDRTRLRYRARVGANYQINSWASSGLRLRTGNPDKQQDPQITLGKGFEEFGTLPIGFEKIFFKAEAHDVVLWLGKNTFPFEKSNELFWSDNVYPEGVYLKKSFQFNSKFPEQLDISGGHFISSASGTSLSNDSYFQGVQASLSFLDKEVIFFPTFYYFKNMPDVPDGNESFHFDYSILHMGARMELIEKPQITLELDYYANLEDYSDNAFISPDLKDQKNGINAAVSLGKLKNKGDWLFKVTYAYMERYAAIDFFAQNDWARWDYSSFGSADGRLTNLSGVELLGGYMIDDKLSLKLKYYQVQQIIPYGIARETGHRMRLDLDIKF